jgi:2,5-diketo-D-gluconate reductase A
MVQTAARSAPSLPLNDGHAMPQLGLCLWELPPGATGSVVQAALEAGYRLIDTAADYGNEAAAGEAVRAAAVSREEIFVVTKLPHTDQGYDEALDAFERSLERLGLDYVDLYLIHWPAPALDRYIDSWRALIRLKEEGRARSIGVANFMVEHLRRIMAETGVAPVVNQIELHPVFQQTDLRAFQVGQGIDTQSWAPLGRGRLLKHPVIARVAARHGKTPAQAIIRWEIDSGLAVVPRSASFDHIAENAEVFDFRLDDEDMIAIAALDDPNGRIGGDPVSFRGTY